MSTPVYIASDLSLSGCYLYATHSPKPWRGKASSQDTFGRGKMSEEIKDSTSDVVTGYERIESVQV